jgi:hypothetical protein
VPPKRPIFVRDMRVVYRKALSVVFVFFTCSLYLTIMMQAYKGDHYVHKK